MNDRPRAGPNLNKTLPELPPGHQPTAPSMHPRHRADAAPRRHVPSPVDSGKAQATYVGPYIPTPNVNEENIMREYHIYTNPGKSLRPHVVFTSAPTSPEPRSLKKVSSFNSLKSLTSPVAWLKEKVSSRKNSIDYSRPLSAPSRTEDEHIKHSSLLYGTSITVEKGHFDAAVESNMSQTSRFIRLRDGSPPRNQDEIIYLSRYRQQRARGRDSQWQKHLHGESDVRSEFFDLWYKSITTMLPHERRELYARAAQGDESAAQQWKELLSIEQAQSALAAKREHDKAFFDNLAKAKDRSPTKAGRSVRSLARDVKVAAVRFGSDHGLYHESGRMTISDTAPPGTMDLCSVCGNEPTGSLVNNKCRDCNRR